MKENILINSLIKEEELSRTKELFLIITGVLFLGLTAKIIIPLSFTPIPVTGQTFGVLLIGLVYGRKLGLKTILSYLGGGILGIPLFANLGTGFFFLKPTAGYLIGYIFVVLICGYLSERSWGKSYVKTFLIMIIAEFVMYFFGLLYLSFFVKENLLMMGLYPFIIGDIIKMLLVTFSIPSAWKLVNFFKK